MNNPNQQEPANNPFIVCVDGRPPLQFQSEKDYFVADLPNPGQISNIMITLLTPIAPDKACCLFYSLPPYNDFEFLIAVANQRPSEIATTNFPLNPQTNSLSVLKLIV